MVGLNVRSPWSTLLINGQKSVETRSYRLPQRLEGVELALIETPMIRPMVGWIVKSVKKFENSVDPPAKRGIIYAKDCLLEK